MCLINGVRYFYTFYLYFSPHFKTCEKTYRFTHPAFAAKAHAIPLFPLGSHVPVPFATSLAHLPLVWSPVLKGVVC